jgi:hypothetical protein
MLMMVVRASTAFLLRLSIDSTRTRSWHVITASAPLHVKSKSLSYSYNSLYREIAI